MKRLLLMLLCLSVAVVSCKEADVEVQSITITPSEDFVLNEGETQELMATVTPADATNPTITWESSNPTVASIEGSTVTANSHGSTTLTATASNGLSESVELAVSPAGGVVVEDGWWKIYNAMGLAAFRDAVNGVVEAPQIAINGKLMADIYLDGVEWTPIGVLASTQEESVPYMGDFDGNDKKIFGLKIDADTTQAGVEDENEGKAFFSYISGEIESGTVVRYASIKDLTIVEPEVYGYQGIAAMVSAGIGINIENCHIEGGIVKALSDVGGIISAAINVKMAECSNSANVVAWNGDNVGGICSIIEQGELEHCINMGEIKGNESAAGIVGEIFSGFNLVSFCVNKGKVSANNAGGIVGLVNYGYTAIYGCVNTEYISGQNSIGGLGGSLKNIVIGASYNLGAVAATDNADSYCGGISGKLDSTATLYGVYSIGVINAQDLSTSGGISGEMEVGKTVVGNVYWVPSADGDAVDAIGNNTAMTADIETTMEALNGAALIDSLNVGVEKFITEFNADSRFMFDITDDIKVEFVMGDDGYPVLQKVN